MEDTSTGEVYHLLWSSDRLEIAREVESRITQIYADLVSQMCIRDRLNVERG